MVGGTDDETSLSIASIVGRLELALATGYSR